VAGSFAKLNRQVVVQALPYPILPSRLKLLIYSDAYFITSLSRPSPPQPLFSFNIQPTNLQNHPKQFFSQFKPRFFFLLPSRYSIHPFTYPILLSSNMNSHNWPSVQNGQPQYPPFNPSTASYTSAVAQSSMEDFANLSPTSSALTYHVNPEHDITGAGNRIGLTLEQYNAVQRASIAPFAPLTTPANNKRQLSHDQVWDFSP
jgi:hypothetical protein